MVLSAEVGGRSSDKEEEEEEKKKRSVPHHSTRAQASAEIAPLEPFLPAIVETGAKFFWGVVRPSRFDSTSS